MTKYDLDTNLNFGKYKDKTIRDVLLISPKYIEWCIINIKFFYLDATIEEINSVNPKYNLSQQAIVSLNYKFNNSLGQNLKSPYNKKISYQFTRNNEYDDINYVDSDAMIAEEYCGVCDWDDWLRSNPGMDLHDLLEENGF